MRQRADDVAFVLGIILFISILSFLVFEEAEVANDMQIFPCGLCPVKTLNKSEVMMHIIRDHDTDLSAIL